MKTVHDDVTEKINKVSWFREGLERHAKYAEAHGSPYDPIFFRNVADYIEELENNIEFAEESGFFFGEN